MNTTINYKKESSGTQIWFSGSLYRGSRGGAFTNQDPTLKEFQGPEPSLLSTSSDVSWSEHDV